MSDSTNVKDILDTMFKGMDGFVNSKTVVGEPVKVGDATLIPLIEVSCGMGAGDSRSIWLVMPSPFLV